MKILVIGNADQLAECKQKFGHAVLDEACSSWSEATERLGNDVGVFDFVSADSEVPFTVPHSLFALFVDTTRSSLGRWFRYHRADNIRVYGFCGMRSFLNRDVLEVVVPRNGSVQELETVCQALGTAFQVVDDQVGMVSPRVIGMIINEAYYTLYEGTATREDIDLAMKLGTNYPYGPFEWAERIGLKNLVALLDAVHQNTGDDRYRVCPLLIEKARFS
jgi:3-hydroxybutyryl-CoA dehydrogenase